MLLLSRRFDERVRALHVYGLLPILGKACDPYIGEGVLHHLHEHFKGHAGDGGTSLGRLYTVYRMTDAGCKYLDADSVHLEHLDNIPY